jgi:hypothetical protein
MGAACVMPYPRNILTRLAGQISRQMPPRETAQRQTLLDLLWMRTSRITKPHLRRRSDLQIRNLVDAGASLRIMSR